MYSVVNSLNVCAASGVTIYDVMKQLTKKRYAIITDILILSMIMAGSLC